MLAEAVEAAKRKAEARLQSVWREDTVVRARAAAARRLRSHSPGRRAQNPQALPELNYGSKEDALEVLVSKEQYERLTAQGAGSLLAAPEPAAAAPAPEPVAAPLSGPDAWGDWRRILDPANGKPYFYNAATAETTWTQPQGWGTHAPASALPPGFFYRDLSGVVQGPFSLEQLAAWRSALPLELQVWWSGGGAAAGVAATVPLAQALGDGELLARLRSGELQLPANATAAQVEAAVAAEQAAEAEMAAWFEAQQAIQDAAAGAEAAAGEETGGGCSFSELAAAAMAGLPAEERQRMLSGAAAEAAPRRAAQPRDEYDSVPVLNKLTGRLTSSSELHGEEALAARRGVTSSTYFDPQLTHYLDVNKLEEFLQRRKELKGKPLPPEVWKQLRDRREAKAKARANSWLRD